MKKTTGISFLARAVITLLLTLMTAVTAWAEQCCLRIGSDDITADADHIAYFDGAEYYYYYYESGATVTLTYNGDDDFVAVSGIDGLVAVEGEPKKRQFVINKDEYIYIWVIYDISVDDLTYDGTAQDIPVTIGDFERVLGRDYTAVVTAREGSQLTNGNAVNAGDYTIAITGLGNLIGSASVDFSIVPLPATFDWENTSFTYDGQEHAPTATVSNLVAGDVCTVTVSGGETEASDSPYTAYVSGLSNPNYDCIDAEREFTIYKRPITVTITGRSDEVTYNGREQSVSGYEATTDDDLYSTYNVNYNYGYGYPEAEGTDAGTYYMYLDPNDFSNDDSNFDVTFDVTDGWLTINPYSDYITVYIDGNYNNYDVIYDGTEHSVEGYTAYYVSGDNGLYDADNDICYNDFAIAYRTDAVTTYMDLDESNFENLNDNFSNVNFSVSDGYITIDPASVTVYNIEIEGKEYDGTTEANFSSTDISLDGIIGSDDVCLDYITATYEDKNVGDSKTVTFDYTYASLSGPAADNYELDISGSTTTAYASITPRGIAINGLSADDKEYDGTTEATIDCTNASIDGMVDGDNLEISSVTGVFVDKNVGEDKYVAIDVTLGGADASNYELCEGVMPEITASITPKSVTISNIYVEDKDYDGSTTATLNADYLLIDGMVEGDALTVNFTDASANYADANAEENKPITITGVTLSGADAGNYTLSAQPTGVIGNITPKVLTVTANPKTISQGSEAANNGVDFEGFIEGEDESVLSGTLSYNYKTKSDGTGVDYGTTSSEGIYYIVLSGLTSTNYDIRYVSGTLTVVSSVVLFAANSTNLWATFCDLCDRTLPDGCTAYTISSVRGSTLNLSQVSVTNNNNEKVIPAYTPVLIKRTAVGTDAVTAVFNAEATVSSSGYDSATGIITATITGATFYGNVGISVLTATDLNGYVYDYGNDAGKQSYILHGGDFIVVDNISTTGIAAHRCWLNVSTSTTNGARLLSINIDDDTTGITTTDCTNSTDDSSVWYSLDGRKLNGKPMKKGLYIHNGVKTVIK